MTKIRSVKLADLLTYDCSTFRIDDSTGQKMEGIFLSTHMHRVTSIVSSLYHIKHDKLTLI